MRLSETSRGTAWLSQFEVDDVPYARRMADTIQVANWEQIRNYMESRIGKLSEEVPGDSSIAILPVISVEDMRPFVDEIDKSAVPVAFTEYDPYQDIGGDPGSEALFANFIRNFTAASSRPFDVVAPSKLHKDEAVAELAPGVRTANSEQRTAAARLELLRRKKTRLIVCVTDYIGSGVQVNRFVDSLHQNPTLRSWRSYKLMKIAVIAFASTEAGLNAVKKNKHVDLVSARSVVEDIKHLSKTIGGKKFEQICKIYKKRGRLKRHPLGFGGVGGLYASSFSVPNNLPAIFIARTPYWEPLFDGRYLPADLLAELFSDSHSKSEYGKNFPGNITVGARGGPSSPILLTKKDFRSAWIYILSSPRKPIRDLATTLAVSVDLVCRAKESQEKLGLVDSKKELTPAGICVLERAKKASSRIDGGLAGRSDEYYPSLGR